MNDFKYCPHCARPLAPNQDGVPACPEGHYAAYVDVVAGAGVLPIKDGRVLIARRGQEPAKGAYEAVGGFMEPGETPEQTAIREAREETGLEVKLTRLLGVFPGQYRDKPTINFYYLADVVSGEAAAADDVAALEWHDIDHLPASAFTDGLPDAHAAFRALQTWYRQRRHLEA
jgi:8-oxo-dGTP diphosphatase